MQNNASFKDDCKALRFIPKFDTMSRDVDSKMKSIHLRFIRYYSIFWFDIVTDVMMPMNIGQERNIKRLETIKHLSLL